MASVGPTLCGSGGVQSLIGGTITWTNPGNITAQDSTGATATFTTNGEYTEYLRAYNFGFSIPTDATINGIVVEVNKYNATYGFGDLYDKSVRLRKSTSITGDNKADISTPYGDQYATATYGSSTDAWSLTGGLSPTEVNDSAFGVVFSVQVTSPIDTIIADVDYIQMTVYYTPVAGPASSVSSRKKASFFQVLGR